MCKIQDKRVLFNHFIDEIVKYERKDTQNKEEVDEVLQEYNMAKLMTLLYFACLSSVPNNEDEEFNYEKETLFGVFDNFITDLYGPVEVDLSIYGRFLPNYTFDKGQFKKEDQESQEKNSKKDHNLKDYKEMINGFFEKEKEKEKEKKNIILLSKETNDIVALYQKLELWNYASRTSNKRLAVRNTANLILEKKAYKKAVCAG